MNAITTIDPNAIGLHLPPDLAFDAWCDLGHSLIGNQRRADWLVADWAKHGREHFQGQFAFIVEQTGMDPKRLSSMAKVADAFPEPQRASNLSFEVHREIAAVSEGERLTMLKQAAQEHWTERQAHHHVVEHKYEQGSLLPDDDPENREAVEIIRAWNRASPDARRYFWDLAETVKFSSINEGVTIDA
jgi:hypothetical protein